MNNYGTMCPIPTGYIIRTSMTTQTTSSDFFIISGIFLFSLILFTIGLSGQEIIGFESRFYLFAQEMWRNGISAFPTTYDQPYPDYPATSTILIYIVSLFAGGLTKLTAVLPSAVAAAITVVITYLLGALHNKRWGYYAAFFLLLTFTFFRSARTISLDMYVTTITVGCFYIVYSADYHSKNLRLWWTYPLLVLAFIFRGPMGVVIPAGVITMYYFFCGEYKRFFIAGLSAGIILSIGTIFLLSLADYVGGDPFMHDVLDMEVAGRINNHFLPFYYYFIASLSQYALAYPVAIFALIGICYMSMIRNVVSPEMKFVTKLFVFVMVILLGLSIPGDKKIRYILPMTPALALIAAYSFVAPAKDRYFIFMRSLLNALFMLLPSLCIMAVFLLSQQAAKIGFIPAQSAAYTVCFLFLAQIAIGGIYYFSLRRKMILK